MFDKMKSERPDIFIAQYTSCAYVYWGVFTGAYITTPFYESDNDALCNKTCKYNLKLQFSLITRSLINLKLQFSLINDLVPY